MLGTMLLQVFPSRPLSGNMPCQPSAPAAALSWLRRRGPPLPESALHKLFRQQTVRLYDPASQRVCRVSKARQLPPGATLLLPKTAVAAATPGSSAGGRGKEGASARSGASTGGDGTSSRSAPRSLASQQAQAWLARLRGGVLHQDPDFLAINKPAGLACQGGSGLALSLDGLMGEAFGGVPGVQAEQLRLVHRLDKQTTGACGVWQRRGREFGWGCGWLERCVGHACPAAKPCLHAAHPRWPLQARC